MPSQAFYYYNSLGTICQVPAKIFGHPAAIQLSVPRLFWRTNQRTFVREFIVKIIMRKNVENAAIFFHILFTTQKFLKRLHVIADKLYFVFLYRVPKKSVYLDIPFSACYNAPQNRFRHNNSQHPNKHLSKESPFRNQSKTKNIRISLHFSKYSFARIFFHLIYLLTT